MKETVMVWHGLGNHKGNSEKQMNSTATFKGEQRDVVEKWNMRYASETLNLRIEFQLDDQPNRKDAID